MPNVLPCDTVTSPLTTGPSTVRASLQELYFSFRDVTTPYMEQPPVTLRCFQVRLISAAEDAEMSLLLRCSLSNYRCTSKGSTINWQHMDQQTEKLYRRGITQSDASTSRDGHFALITLREVYSELMPASASLAYSDFGSARHGFVYAKTQQCSVHPAEHILSGDVCSDVTCTLFIVHTVRVTMKCYTGRHY